MNIKTLFLSVLSAAVSASGFAQTAIETTPDGYTLRWSDEFNGTALNEKIWNIEVNGNGGGNQELQYYRRENVSVEDGNLVLTARRENFNGKAFTSGRVTTQNKAAFKHGILQAKIKFPHCSNGLWPAYWMMGNDMSKYGWPRCGEMDIVELGHANGIANGTQDRYFGGTLHYGPDASNEHHQQLSQEYIAKEDNPIAGDYHIITVEWDETNLYMYYDLAGYKAANKRNARYFSTTISYSDDVMAPGHYFQKPFFFLFNLAVGGMFPSIYDPAGITALSQIGDEAKMYVDWVRVYQKDGDENSQYTYVDEDGNTQTNIPEEPEPPHQDDNVTELSSFATPALNEQGESTFDFDDAEEVVLISTSEGVTGNFQSRNAVRANYNVDETNQFLYIWSDTYVPNGTVDKKNSFGWDEGYNRYAVTTVGWSGLGFASPEESTGKDLSMLDDSYWLHFAMKADDPDIHTSHTVGVGDAKFRVGVTDGTAVSLGDFKRDGKWYYFDIPLKAIRQFADPIFPSAEVNAYKGNVISFLSGGLEGAELDFDNIFFYKSKTKDIPNFTDTKSNLGKYGYKSLDENGNAVFDFDKAENVIPIVLSQDMWEHLTAGGTYTESIVAQENDYSEQAGKNNFFIWGDPQTFTASQLTDTPNSFGNNPYGGFNVYKSAIGQGWNGMGWASIAGQGNNPTPKDLSKIDDTYCLHFSVRSDAAVGHTPITVKLGSEGGDAAITLGSYSLSPIFADFNRDGEWYSFDIPVVEFKKYGKLWSAAGKGDNGTLDAFKGYVLCVNTMSTYYSGSGFSIDNVFFYQPKDQSIIPSVDPDALGEYTTKSLDETGKSYFDFSNKEFIPITAGAAERAAMGEDNIIADFSINDQNTHVYPWEGTLDAGTAEGNNSFGNPEGWISFVVADKGWSGLGITNDDGYDLSQIADDTYFHFALRSTSDAYDFHLILGKAHFTIGYAPYVNGSNEVYPVLGNLKRDGEWYSFDIPVSEFKKINSNLWNGQVGCFKDNLFCAEFGGTQGNELHLDNMFFWREKGDPSGIDNPQIANPTANRAIGTFDISGRKVQNMSKPGLYIIRTANSVRKVIVK